MADEKALLDSGATENFVDETTWQRLGIGRKELKKPITITNVDGTENKRGKITHYCWLCIQKETKDKLQRFFITNLGVTVRSPCRHSVAVEKRGSREVQYFELQSHSLQQVELEVVSGNIASRGALKILR
jgi:hypothetical protein